MEFLTKNMSMSKINTKKNKEKKNKVNEAKTDENIKYKPILSQSAIWFNL